MERYFEEYDDTSLYDKENRGGEDIEFLKEVVRNIDGVIVDIACGTGRATIPLAIEGKQLIGIDVHKGMLDAATKKGLEKNVSIEWIKEDCTNFDLGLKTKLIYSVGNSFQHFLTNEDQDGLISSVSKHLEKGGLFIFDTRFPSADELLQPPTEEYWTSYIDPETGQKVELSTISHYDNLEQIQYYTTIRRYLNEGNVINELKTRIKLRYVYPKEMERLLEQHQLQVKEVYSDWKKTPLHSKSYSMIYVCEKI
ncbi:class I SAM-dependent methyltransferase [Solibacillus sp. CAU 1738]|uniref:class I SAM-dependent DNA methyltransferase n=1 Tax=Solibacillus sp. CAU 1738 TaxID=3140363 RepID=UPI003261C406